MTNGVTLYKSLSPVQLAQVVSMGWRAFPALDPDQQIFAPKLHRAYAEMLARQMEMANFQAGYVVMFTVQLEFLQQFKLETIGYQEHEEYRIPVQAMGALNHAIIGRIELVSGFAMVEESCCRSVAVDQFVSCH